MTEPQSTGRSLARAAAYATSASILLLGITMAVAAGGFFGPGYLGRVLILVFASAIAFIVSGLGARHPNGFHLLAVAALIASVGVALLAVHDRFIGCGPSHVGPCDPGLDWQGGLRLAILSMGTAAGTFLTAVGTLRSRRPTSG